jgi:mono/diheme cytochrome c family protein
MWRGRGMGPGDCSVCCAPLMRLPALASLVVALALTGCGAASIQLPEDDPDYEGAELFVEHCSGCHTFEAAGTEGSASKVSSRENKDGPNFNQRKESAGDVLYAIENGGFSSGPMPQNIVTGEDAQKIADFVAKYSGPGAPKPGG